MRFLLQEQSGRGMKLTTHSHLGPRLKCGTLHRTSNPIYPQRTHLLSIHSSSKHYISIPLFFFIFLHFASFVNSVPFCLFFSPSTDFLSTIYPFSSLLCPYKQHVISSSLSTATDSSVSLKGILLLIFRSLITLI